MIGIFKTSKARKIFGLFLMGSVAATAAKADEPSRWLLKDHDTTIHIMGTIHALPEGTRWLSESTRDALYGSDTLVLEVPPGHLLGGGMTKEQEKDYFLPRHTYLYDVIDEDLYKSVALRMEELSLPVQTWGRLKPWAVAQLVAASFNMDTELSALLGVELTMMAMIKDEYKNVIGLETDNSATVAQLAMADEDGVQAIRIALREGALQEEWVLRLIDAWKVGDDELLADLSLELDSWSEFPKYSKAMLEDRNRVWVDSVEHLMRFKGTYFIAVGAAHLVGENNFIQLLANEGMVAERRTGTGPIYSAPEGSDDDGAAEPEADEANGEVTGS